MIKNNQKTLYAIIVAVVSALISYIIFGMITAVIPNKFFIRMMPIYWYDYFFLIATSILLGIFLGLYYYSKNAVRACNYTVPGGVFTGVLSFGCAFCNQILVGVLGISGVLTYFIPIQPILGVVSILILAYSVFLQYTIIKKSGNLIL